MTSLDQRLIEARALTDSARDQHLLMLCASPFVDGFLWHLDSMKAAVLFDLCDLSKANQLERLTGQLSTIEQILSVLRTPIEASSTPNTIPDPPCQTC